MSIETFEEQISMYRLSNFSEFRRINLVYSFQDLIHTLTSKEQVCQKLIKSISHMIQLNSLDDGLFPAICQDLLEPTIRLQILLAPMFPKALTDLSILLVTSSKAPDFQSELSTIMCLLASKSSSHPLEQFRDFRGSEITDNLKTVITFYIPNLLRIFEDSELQTGIAKLMEYLEFIRIEIENYHAALGSELMLEIFSAIIDRKSAVVEYSGKECLVFMLELLDIYRKLNKFHENKKKLVFVISEIYGNFEKIFKQMRNWGIQNNEMVAFLASKSIKGDIKKLCLNWVVSGRYRLKVFVPAAAYTENMMLCWKIIDYCVLYCDGEINPYQITSFYPDISPSHLLSKVLEILENKPGSNLRQRRTTYKKLWSKFEIESKFNLVEVMMSRERSDEKAELLLRILIDADQGQRANKIIKITLSLSPAKDYINCLRAFAQYLERVNIKKSSIDEKLRQAMAQLRAELLGEFSFESPDEIKIIAELEKLI